jgi:hypothetical protein
MNDFSRGCRVRCIDATPVPLNVAGAVIADFSFPDGFIAEGEVYVVEGVFPAVRGGVSLMLVEKRVFLQGREIPWCGARFRRLEAGKPPGERRVVRKAERESAEVSS